MQNSVITEEEYDRERDVIQSEFSMGQGEPNRIFWKLTQQARFAAQPDHPGAHPTIGYLDEFLTVTRDQIYAFYKRMYVPNNMVMVVAGDIDPTEADRRDGASAGPTCPRPTCPRCPSPPSDGRAAAEPVTVEGVAAVSRQRERLLWPGVKLGAEHDFRPGPGGRGAGRRRVVAAGPQAARRAAAGDQASDAFNYSASLGRRLLRGRLRAGRPRAVRGGPRPKLRPSWTACGSSRSPTPSWPG